MRSGWMICLIGLMIGILLSLGFYVLQKQFGIVPIPEGFVVNSYPIQLRWTDIITVGITVFIIGSLAAWMPARKASKIVAYIREEWKVTIRLRSCWYLQTILVRPEVLPNWFKRKHWRKTCTWITKVTVGSGFQFLPSNPCGRKRCDFSLNPKVC